jgi:hypothetical protein
MGCWAGWNRRWAGEVCHRVAEHPETDLATDFSAGGRATGPVAELLVDLHPEIARHLCHWAVTSATPGPEEITRGTQPLATPPTDREKSVTGWLNTRKPTWRRTFPPGKHGSPPQAYSTATERMAATVSSRDRVETSMPVNVPRIHSASWKAGNLLNRHRKAPGSSVSSVARRQCSSGSTCNATSVRTIDGSSSETSSDQYSFTVTVWGTTTTESRPSGNSPSTALSVAATSRRHADQS